MPDRQIDRFIRFCLHNNGRLSARKQARHVAFPADAEIARMEETDTWFAKPAAGT